MDSILEKLLEYEHTATPEQKQDDLARIEAICPITSESVFADEFIESAFSRTRQRAVLSCNIHLTDLNPDYSLDFYLSNKTHKRHAKSSRILV